MPKDGSIVSGDIQCGTPGSQYKVCTISNTSGNINLFRGSQLQGFKAGASAGDATISLDTYTTNGNAKVDLVNFPVRVTNAVVGSTSTPTNRGIESFTNLRSTVLREFLGGGLVLQGTTSLGSTTNSQSAGRPITAINANITATSPGTITSIDTLPAYNGNANIRAVKGDLTVNCPVGKTSFEMTGVRTILVEGSITFNCNTVYPSNDTTSSWAWIAKGGDIKVSNGTNTTTDKGLTNLAGVYVAIKENNHGGNITYAGQTTTTAILRVDGILYGNAQPLFNSRTYARGTTSYDILTTGTILTYSNRALTNPPPLLSQYLNNYQVQRVTR